MPDQSLADKTAKIHDALPESKWVYRRVLTFGWAICSLLLMLLISVFVAKLGIAHPAAAAGAIKGLTGIVMSLAVVNGLLLTYYLVAPSGEQIMKMFATVAALKSGVNVGGILHEIEEKVDPKGDEPLGDGK